MTSPRCTGPGSRLVAALALGLALLPACGGGRSGAVPVCGDGVAESWEVCDGVDLRGQSCVTLGHAGGGCGVVDPDCPNDRARSCTYCTSPGSCAASCNDIRRNDNAHCR